MLSAVLLSSIYSCLKKEKRGSLKLWKHISKQPFGKMKKKSKKKKKKFFFFLNLGAKADPRYKRSRVITRRVLTGLTCTTDVVRNLA